MHDTQRAFLRMNDEWYIGDHGRVLIKGYIILTKNIFTNKFKVAASQTPEQKEEGNEMCQILNSLKNG